MKEKACLALILDDGQDWSGKALITFYFLGELWTRLDLDFLAITRNAPGDSKWNAVERFWGYLTKVLASVTIPHPKEADDDLGDDESIDWLVRECMSNMKFDGHEVHTVPVKCTRDTVEIKGKIIDNNQLTSEEADVIQSLMSDKKNHRRLIEDNHPEIAKKLRIFHKHCDIRLHGYYFRKCHPKEKYRCSFCRAHPVRGSDKLWSCLPLRSAGGLFFDCVEDEKNPGHYKTLLDLLGDMKTLKISPDGMFADTIRCKVNIVGKNCISYINISPSDI